MKILSSKSIKGIGHFNNDICKKEGNFAYVIDGATAQFNDNIFFKTSDLYEYMQLLKNNIPNFGCIMTNLQKGIEKSNLELKNITRYKEYKLPTFTISAVKEYKHYYEVYLLCDCLISILYQDGTIENIIDHRFDKTEQKCRNEFDKIKGLKVTKLEKSNLRKKALRACRKYANVAGGYPVGSTNPKRIKRGIIKRINKDDVKRILICSDGLYNTIGMPSEKSYFSKTSLENKINDNKNYDDLTYMLISNA